jgi:hypothetical protein
VSVDYAAVGECPDVAGSKKKARSNQERAFRSFVAMVDQHCG